YPILYKIALDVLPIQASAVSCERIFSSSKETCTTRRNRLSPLMIEALQMLKFAFKQDRLDFTEGWTATEKEFGVGFGDEELSSDISLAQLRELISSGKIQELQDTVAKISVLVE
ncbi:hypothetical protein BOTBODRAFT_121261, partial [Botryobasidium botryosum FD-172 SS1]